MEKQILYRYFENTASPEEEDAVHNWFEASASNREEFFKEREFFDAMIFTVRTEKNKSAKEDEFKMKKRSFMRSAVREVLKAAAIIAITVSCGLYFYLAERKELLSAVNTITVPAGERASLKLPDGTVVWLNARSEMIYPAVFSGSKREVQLNGEAYFEVEHNAKSPFVVHTSRCDIEVLGTKFNVEAYSDSEDFSTSLMEGAVKVRDHAGTSGPVMLKPDQEARLKDNRLLVSSIEDYDQFRWREGLVCFKHVYFKELMTRFEKCYGIRIVVENKHLDEYTCTGKFRISDGLDNALRILQKDAGYIFERDEDNLAVYIK